MKGGFAVDFNWVGWMVNLTEVKDLSQSEFGCWPLNTRPHLVQVPPKHGAKQMSGTLGLTLEPGGMARFQADLVIPRELANQVYGLLEALQGSTKWR
jgi:hypothetical protein